MMNQRVRRDKNGRIRVDLSRLWVPVFIMVGISILSGSAGIQTGGWSFVGMDKLGHLVVFGLLGIAWFRCFDNENVPGRTRLLYAIALTTAFGMADEAHQYHNPSRTFEWADLLADFIGAVLAGTLYWRVSALRNLLEVKLGQVSRLPSSSNPSN